MIWDLITKIKIFKDRAQGWASPYSFFMMYYLFLEKIWSTDSLQIISDYIPLHWARAFLTVAPPVLIAISTVCDIKNILPREQEYYFKRNPEWQKRNER